MSDQHSQPEATVGIRAAEIVRRLQDAGHEALFAGGCVRDRLLGRTPCDYDVATSATPADVERIFPRTVPVGRQFGIVLVVDQDLQFEVATFREDGAYIDGRRPESVSFTDAEHDAQRRDFTINAMFEDPITGSVIDYVGGKKDLEAGVIRAVGNPAARFGEDRLRLIRAVRFAARFGFEIEPATRAAIREAAASITEVSRERLGDEIVKILTEGSPKRGFELLDELGLLEAVLPEIPPMKECNQSPDHHPEGDVFVHTLACLDQLEAGCSESLAFGVLLHDVAKARTAKFQNGRYTFYGHCEVGAKMAVGILKRLRRSTATSNRVEFLVAQHLRHCAAKDMKASTLKRFLRQDGIEELIELARIDALGSSGDLGHYHFCANALATLAPEEVRPRPLVTGRDLIALGLEPGPRFKTILRAVEDAQLEGNLHERDAALDLARSLAGL